MAIVNWDQFTETDAIEGPDGWEATRGALVSELSSTGLARVLEAVNALGVSIGQAHPILPGCTLHTITPRHESPSVIRCTLNYKSLAAGELPSGGAGEGPGTGTDYTITVGAALVSKEINEDRDGTPIEVYTVGEGGESVPAGSYVATVSVPMPQVTISIRRRETTSPLSKAREYVGSVGTAGWTLDPGAGADTWLCTGISGTSLDGRTNWDVSHDFQHDPKGWVTKVYWRDRDTGEIPPELVQYGQYFTLKVHESHNFNRLGF